MLQCFQQYILSFQQISGIQSGSKKENERGKNVVDDLWLFIHNHIFHHSIKRSIINNSSPLSPKEESINAYDVFFFKSGMPVMLSFNYNPSKKKKKTMILQWTYSCLGPLCPSQMKWWVHKYWYSKIERKKTTTKILPYLSFSIFNLLPWILVHSLTLRTTNTNFLLLQLKLTKPNSLQRLII